MKIKIEDVRRIISEEISTLCEGSGAGRHFFYVTVSGQEMGELDDDVGAPADLFDITIPVEEMLVVELLSAANKAGVLTEHSGLGLSSADVNGLHLLGRGVAVEPPYAEGPYDPVEKDIYVYSNKPGRL